MTQIQGGKNIQDGRKKGRRNHEEAEGEGKREKEKERKKEVRLKGKKSVSLRSSSLIEEHLYPQALLPYTPDTEKV